MAVYSDLKSVVCRAIPGIGGGGGGSNIPSPQNQSNNQLANAHPMLTPTPPAPPPDTLAALNQLVHAHRTGTALPWAGPGQIHVVLQVLDNAASELSRLRKIEADVEPMRIGYGKLLKEVYG